MWSSNFTVESVGSHPASEQVDVTIEAVRSGYPLIPDDIHLESGRHRFALEFPIRPDTHETSGVETAMVGTGELIDHPDRIGSPGLTVGDLKVVGLDPSTMDVHVRQSNDGLHLLWRKTYSGKRQVEYWYVFDRNGDVVDAISTEIRGQLGFYATLDPEHQRVLMWPCYWSNYSEKMNGSNAMPLLVWKYADHQVLRRYLDIKGSMKLVNGNYVPRGAAHDN